MHIYKPTKTATNFPLFKNYHPNIKSSTNVKSNDFFRKFPGKY